MNLLSSFGNFYSNLSSDGLFFFWIIVFLFCFLIFLTIILVLKNKKLVKMLQEDQNVTINKISESEETTATSEAKIVEKEDESILEIKKEVNPNIEKVELVIDKKEESKVIEEIKEETGPYKKNVLREMNNGRAQTSPIHIDRNEENNNYGFSESYLREDSVSPLELMEDNYEVNDGMKFASEIVERMEEEIKPSNIELTDYEKKQEEEAIISYDELLKVKDKIYNITEDEDTDEFIDELKSFRLDL